MNFGKTRQWTLQGLCKISIRWLIILALGFLVAIMVLQERWLPYAIASSITPAGSFVGTSTPAPPEVTRQLQVEVGAPSATLSVWIVDPATSVRGTVLVLHGIHDHKLSMLSTGAALSKNGYRAVLVDLRGHGQSSGRWLTYGAVESRDLSQVLDALEREHLIVGPVGVYGHSYGGACAVMLAGRDPRVRAVVSVAGFATMRDEVPYFIRHSSNVPAWLINDKTIARAIVNAGKLAGFDPSEASPLAAIQRTQAAVLLIHGDPDEKVPVAHSYQLHNAAPLHSELLVTASRDGHDAFFADREGVISRATTAWFANRLTPMDEPVE